MAIQYMKHLELGAVTAAGIGLGTKYVSFIAGLPLLDTVIANIPLANVAYAALGLGIWQLVKEKVF